MAWTAVTNHILLVGYFGALPAPSASDLVALLIDNITEAFAQQKCISIVTFDVKGGFDTVLPFHLLHRLQDQKWPTHIIHWVRLFLSKRKAALQIDGYTSEHFPLPGSLPQGFPVSPILFQLFLQPLFAARPLLGTLKRRGYADNGKITALGTNPAANCLVLERKFEDVAQWCQANKIPLDLDKTSLIHFTLSTKDNNPPICLPPNITLQGPRLIEATTKDNSLCWLGVHFDRRLTFKLHIQKVTARAKAIAQALRMLGGCTRGLLPKLA